ncbi:MAG: Na/Pi cotransporter family protein [Kiritimatiellaeota bacterium]|nr:Na/Pi cotransporter family protein [Kiritimatiellota bacterium]
MWEMVSSVYHFVTARHFVDMLMLVVGGLGIFLLGMKMMSDGLQAVAGPRLSKWVGAVTDNRVLAVLVGVGVTGIIQSSSATTVMVVGLVNGGIMTLMQAIGVIFGANIGTTVTAWIVTMNLSKYGLLMVGLSAVPYLFISKERAKNIALVFLGLGLLFAGLEFMSSGFKPLRTDEAVLAWFRAFSAADTVGVIKCICVGTILTMIIQSSSASIAIVMMLSRDGLIHFDSALALVLGGNIGTTITALLASIGTSRNARRAAYAHTLFNLLGVLWVALVFHVFFLKAAMRTTTFFAELFPHTAGEAVSDMDFAYPAFGIAVAHSMFNIVNAILFLPAMGWFAAVVRSLVPVTAGERLAETSKTKLIFLDRRMLATPTLAVEHSHKEIVAMGDMNLRMMEALRPVLVSAEKCEEEIHLIQDGERMLDEAEKVVIGFVSQLVAQKASHAIAEEARRQMRQADELESISDYMVRIVKSRNKILKTGDGLTEEAVREVTDLHLLATAYLEKVIRLLRHRDTKLIEECRTTNATMLRAFKDARTAYLQRVVDEKVTTAKSVIYSDILVEFRRIKDHLQNIVDTVEE